MNGADADQVGVHIGRQLVDLLGEAGVDLQLCSYSLKSWSAMAVQLPIRVIAELRGTAHNERHRTPRPDRPANRTYRRIRRVS